MKDYLENYINQQKMAVDAIPVEEVAGIIELFSAARKNEQQIFVCGNGGSASNASHFITDLGKSSSDKSYRRFRCLSLNENVSWITAIANDYSYDDVYMRQLENYARPGDVLMVLSVSGNSPNIVKAVDWGRQHGLVTIALVGAKKGQLAEIASHVIVINSNHYGRVEDCQMHICHMICYAFIENEFLQVPQKDA